VAKPLSTIPPTSSVAKLLEPGIGAAAIRPVAGTPARTPAGPHAGVPASSLAQAATPTGEPADIKRELTLTRTADRTVEDLLSLFQRTTGCRLHASHLMRALLHAVRLSLPEIEREAEALGPLRRPSNAVGKEAERDAFEARIAACLHAGVRAGRRAGSGE
jgi:hypothetical protein